MTLHGNNNHLPRFTRLGSYLSSSLSEVLVYSSRFFRCAGRHSLTTLLLYYWSAERDLAISTTADLPLYICALPLAPVTLRPFVVYSFSYYSMS